MYDKTIRELGSFIKNSPTAFHAVDTMRKTFVKKGYTELSEAERWILEAGKSYFVTRNDSSIIAFKLGKDLEQYSFHVTASHCDSPTFKLKEHAELTVQGRYTVLNTEGYGGMICSSWLDRPLSVAGRVIVKQGELYETRLVKVDRDLLVIPNVAIHMNRQINDGYTYNKQIDMLPLYSGSAKEDGDLKNLIAESIGTSADKILGMDLYLYNRMGMSVWGEEEEFFSCPQIDDLECAFASMKGFIDGEHKNNINVFACFDNEEVGSGTKQGASSTFLYDVLYRVNMALGKTKEDFLRAVACSMMLSCDNAHAVHPNHPEKIDKNNCTYLNGGVVVKAHAGQKYTSDALSTAIFKGVCEKAGVPVQYFANRSDMAGGSTLGNLAMAQVSMNAVDIGLPQLAMHSAYETAGVKDLEYMIRAVRTFYNSHMEQIDPYVVRFSC